MNNEKLNQIIDKAYENYQWKQPKSFPAHPDSNLSKVEFINKCKTDPKFSEKWGLKIEEKELSLEERVKLYGTEKINTTDAGYYEHSYAQFKIDEAKIPTKLITVTYNNKTIENYE